MKQHTECKKPSSMLGAWGGGFRGARSCVGENQDPQSPALSHQVSTTTTASPSSKQQHTATTLRTATAMTTTTEFQFHTCGHCFKRCKSAELLRQHESQARHSPHDPRCGACGKHFANLDTLRQHLDGQLPSQKCKARYQESGCTRCLAISPEGSPPHGGGGGGDAGEGESRCPFEIALKPAATSAVLSISDPVSRGVGDASPPSSSSSSPSSADDSTTTTTTLMPTTNTATAKATVRGPASGGARSPRAAVALDCEMVGTEEDGGGAMCARVCVVDEAGDVLLSTYVAPSAPVTDHRTAITGITAEVLLGAPPLAEVRARVLSILNGGGGGTQGVHCGQRVRGGGGGGASVGDGDGGDGGGGRRRGGERRGGGGKILLVGHDLHHDLDCLEIRHPEALCRDTAHYPLFQRHTHHPYKLGQLAATLLGTTIQAEGAAHDPEEDAVAAMRLYLGGRALCDAHHPGGVSDGNDRRGGGGGGGGVSRLVPPGCRVSDGPPSKSPLSETHESPSRVAFAAVAETEGLRAAGRSQNERPQQRGRGGSGTERFGGRQPRAAGPQRRGPGQAQGQGRGQGQRREQGSADGPRFRCWCGDRATPTAAGAGARARAEPITSTTTVERGGPSPSPLKVLKDVTNAHTSANAIPAHSSPGIKSAAKAGVWVSGGS